MLPPDPAERRRRHEEQAMFAARLAHDLNNLLMSINGNLQLARRRLDDPERLAGHLEKIAGAATTLESISGRLLNIAGWAGGDVSSIDLADTCRGVADRVSRPDGIDLTVRVDAPVPPCRGAGERVEILVTKLLENALEAASPGEAVELTVAHRELTAAERDEHVTGLAAADGPHFVITVAGGCRTAEEEHLARMFHPGYSSKPEGRGRGLGLNEVVGLATAMNGGAHVHRPDAGSLEISVFWP